MTFEHAQCSDFRFDQISDWKQVPLHGFTLNIVPLMDELILMG